MTSICLSVVCNIRCTNLSRWQSVVLVIVSSVDVAVALKFLSVNWRHMGQFHWALVLEVVFYFCLSLFDFLLEQNGGGGIALYLFQAYDEAIGILTIFPLFLFMAALLLLAHCDILPLTYRFDLRRPTLFGLMLLIPPVLILNVVAGLVGITYVQSPTPPMIITPTHADFSAQFATSLLSDLAGIFLAIIDLILGGSCIFYIIRSKSRGVGGGVIPGFRWVAAGLLIASIDSLMGMGMMSMGGFGFWLVLARRILRQLSRTALFVGFVHGTSLEQGFVLYPREPTTPRIQSSLRSNPIALHSHAYDNNNNPRPISFGLSDAVENRARRRSDARPIDKQEVEQPVKRPPLPVRLSSKFFANFSHTKSIPTLEKDSSPPVKPGFTPFDSADLALAEEIEARGWNKPSNRVTVEFPLPHTARDSATAEPRAPMLHLRFSALNMPSVNQLISALSLRTSSNVNTGSDLEMNTTSASNRADQSSHGYGAEDGTGTAARRASWVVLGNGIRHRLSQVMGRSSEARQSMTQAGTRPVSMPLAPQLTLDTAAQKRLSLGVGPVERGQWILIKKENPGFASGQRQSDFLTAGTQNKRRTWVSMARSLDPGPESVPESATDSISASASDNGNIQASAQIVQVRSVTVSTQMSTLLYSPQMGGIVGAQILQESSSPSPRNELKLQLASSGASSSSASPSPQSRARDILAQDPSQVASGSRPVRTTAARVARGGKSSSLGVGNHSSGETAFSNEEGDYFSFRPQQVPDVTGARVRIRTPTIISNAETRKSVPLEHGWATTIAEEPPASQSQRIDTSAATRQPLATRVLPVQDHFARFEENYNHSRLLANTTEEGDRATISVPPAYENHRRDTLALADPTAAGGAAPLGGLGDLL